MASLTLVFDGDARTINYIGETAKSLPFVKYLERSTTLEIFYYYKGIGEGWSGRVQRAPEEC